MKERKKRVFMWVDGVVGRTWEELGERKSQSANIVHEK